MRTNYIKIALLMVVLLLLSGIVGCGEKDKVQPNDQAKEITSSNETIKVAYVAMTNGSAQVFINQKYDIISKSLGEVGHKVEYIDAHGLQEVYPLMDQGTPDFIYIPHTAYTTYATEKSKYGGTKGKYTVIAGSVNFNDVNLVTRPEIKSLKDLEGKKVGIANLRYADDYQLNKVLSKVGLNTSTYGGTVEVVWEGIIKELWDNYGAEKYDAIVNFDNANNLPRALSMVSGSNVFSLNPDGLYGDKQPRVWLAVKNEVIKNNPKLVIEYLKAHILSTEKAKEHKDELPAINRELRMKWFLDKGAMKDYVEEENIVEKFQKSWNNAEITYDPNLDYVSGLYDYMIKNGHYQGIKKQDFVRTDLLNEALKQLGKKPIN